MAIYRNEERLGVDELIRRIYQAGTVVGQTGKVHKLHSAVDPDDGACLAGVIRDDPTVHKTLEVGCAYGLSSLYICGALRGRVGASHTIIDAWQSDANDGWDGAGVRNLQEAGITFFQLIEKRSEFALPRLLEEGEETFDFIFVDGWHTFDHTLLDCFYATRLLRVGGYLAIDDVSWPAIGRVVAFLGNYPCYQLYRSVATDKPRSWKRIVARNVLAACPRKAAAAVLSQNLYRKIFEHRMTRLVVLKKTGKDERDWQWHVDSF